MTYRLGDWQAGKPLPKGFDVADAVAWGWSADEITAFMRATVRPWSPPVPPEPTPPEPTPTPPPADDPGPHPDDPGPVPEPDRATGSGRTFDQLLKAARDLGDDDFDEMEAILAEVRGLPGPRVEAVLKAIKTNTGTSISALRGMLREEGNDVPDHLAIARMTVAEIGRENIIAIKPFVWMWSDVGVWKQQDDRIIKQSIQNTISNAGLAVNSTLVNGVLDVLKTEIFAKDHTFNRGDTETVNCLNGHIVPDGDRWALMPHDRKLYRTTQIPIEYDPEARAPMFELFLSQIFAGDPDAADKSRAVLEMFGYSLMSHARHELFCLLIGKGANGKSVLLTVLEHLCGKENVAGVQPSNFDRSFQRAHLDQKLVNIVTEIKQGEVIADAELKGIVSGERSTVEHKFQDPFDMNPFSTCWFGTNHMPYTRDFSDALFRRALIVRFNRQFSDDEKDPDLKLKLLDELPGILNLALAAYRKACRDGFTKPASSVEAALEWRMEADQVAQWVEDACVSEAGAQIGTGEAFEEYLIWAKKNGITKTVTLKSLRDRLGNLGYTMLRDGTGRYIAGLRMRIGGSSDGW